MSKDTVRQIANAFGIIVALIVNGLATSLPLNGQNTGAISDRFKVFFVPAGYVFAIWGLIYVGWIAFGIYQCMPAHKADPRLRRLGYLFAISCLFNAAWLFCWHYLQFGLSVIVMLVLLGLLIASYLRLNVGRHASGALEKWCVDIPFSVYLGWITVATVANISDYLYFIGWDGFGLAPMGWAVIMIAVAGILGLAMALSRKDSAYQLVLVWSFVGIAVKQAPALPVAYSAWIAALCALVLAVWCIVVRRRKPVATR